MKPLMWIMILGLSFRDVYSDYCPQRTTCSSTCYRSSKYHRDCGLFGWRRCTKYRRRSFTCYVTCYQQACCTGYTGSSCNTPLCDGSTSCPNGGTCRSPDYCVCPTGFSAPLCNDIQPPVLTGCSEDVHINATDHTVQYNWTEPTFTDPMGSDLKIVSNYPSPEFTFPWGDYTVQYVATKTSNGLQTECSFQIKVRPTPCEELNVPVNGARLCNGWKTDYGRFCMIMCQQNYTIGPSQSYYTWHVCGASGNWIAASPVPDCSVPVAYEYEDEYYHPEYAGYVYSSSCEDDATRNTLQTLYIDYLKGTEGFSSFCSTYESECIKENVDVKC